MAASEPGPYGISSEEAPVPESSVDGVDVLPLDPETFGTNLGKWFRAHARKLPWRGVHDPYATWLSEIMLQQTRVATVIDRYVAFMAKFPTLTALAEADESDVLALWSGLGYYRRARMLHRAAQFVTRELRGKLPRNSHDLRTLPGVGEYTAAAIASIAFCESVPVVDGNVERVLLRIQGLAEDGTQATRNRIHAVAKDLVPAKPARRSRMNPAGTHNQAMMELGATICLPRQPLCLQCPVMAFCRTRGEHKALKRQPQKSRVVAHLLALRKSGTITEVLLERRAAEASLMPGMLELPPLPLDAVEGREPVLRLRHAITNTNFYVQIYTEGLVGGAGNIRTLGNEEAAKTQAERLFDDEDSGEDLVIAGTEQGSGSHPLLDAVPAQEGDLCWVAAAKLYELPLTGLARKTLQRLHLMHVPDVRMD